MEHLLECVPNFSEGVNTAIINKIALAAESVSGVKLLHIDSGIAANRSVITFAGEPEAVIEAAFRAIKKASELIDMRNHKGTHPRMGATDVCPLVPLKGLTMEEAATYSHALGRRVGEELDIPVYMYEYAQPNKERSNLATIRSGEYEGFFQKIKLPNWKPDYGPAEMNANTGATVIGARKILGAYNVNLNTTSVKIAKEIAKNIRQSGYINSQGVRLPGTLSNVKAIGWYIEDFKQAQVSMNLVDIDETPIHIAFNEVCEQAQKLGVRVTGSELIGLIPLQAMLDAGKYFLEKQNALSEGISEESLINIAIKSLGLSDVVPFIPNEKIIEFALKKEFTNDYTTKSFNAVTMAIASQEAVPGGGSVSAMAAALASSLAEMVSKLSARSIDDNKLLSLINRLDQLRSESLLLVNKDAQSYREVMKAYALVKTDVDRSQSIEAALLYAAEIPFQLLKNIENLFESLESIVKFINANTLSDLGTAICVGFAAAEGAMMNIEINIKTIQNNQKAIAIKGNAHFSFKKIQSHKEQLMTVVKANLLQ